MFSYCPPAVAGWPHSFVQSRSRVLGLDVGSRFIGVAVSDPTNSWSQPLACLKRRAPGGKTRKPVMEIGREIRELGEAHNVVALCVGWPLEHHVQVGRQAAAVSAFVQELTDRGGLQYPCFLWNEAYSTVEALERIKERRGPRTDFRVQRNKTNGKTTHKEALDIESACVILDSFLHSLHALDPAAPQHW